MKNQIIIFIIFFNLLTSFSYANTNIFYLDLDFIFNNSELGKKITSNLNKLNKDISDQVNKDQKTLMEKEINIKSSKNLLSQEELKNKIDEFNKELKLFNQNKEKLILSYNSNRDKELKKFIQDITPIIQEFMKENSINILLDKKNIFIGKSDNDITAKIIKLINKKLN